MKRNENQKETEIKRKFKKWNLKYKNLKTEI